MLHIGFYQLAEATVTDATIMLTQKARDAGKKMLIYCPKPAASAIDDALWSHVAASWLPHGLDDAPGVEVSAAWICSDMVSNPISAEYVMLLHGAVPQRWNGFRRIFVVFNGKSDTQLQRARLQWQQWKKWPDTTLSYFLQADAGGWEKKA